MNNGYIQIYFGNGKGKSTAAAGLLLRCAANNLKIAVFRFFKMKNTSSEDKLLKNYNIKFFYPKYSSPYFSPNVPLEKIIDEQRKVFDKFKDTLDKNKFDVVVLDEGTDLIKHNIIPLDEFISVLNKKPKNVEIIITGHYINRELKKVADLVTHFKKVKHYYDKGVIARKGIEY